LSVDGDADAAMKAKIHTGWNKFRQSVSVLMNRDISLIMSGDCTAFVCKVVCCKEVRPDMWHFNRQK